MCLGIPMQIQTCEGLRAQCINGKEQQWVDMSLLGEQSEGTWVLVFLGTAREVLEESQAFRIRDALVAVDAVMHGEKADVDRLFADLVQREPQLPPHLQNNKNRS